METLPSPELPDNTMITAKGYRESTRQRPRGVWKGPRGVLAVAARVVLDRWGPLVAGLCRIRFIDLLTGHRHTFTVISSPRT
jgi:hypothetical protein